MQTLAKCSVPFLLTGTHAFLAHTNPEDTSFDEVECAINAEQEAQITEHFGSNEWSLVYRTPLFAKFRLLSTGTPTVKVLFLDPTTFEKLREGSLERIFSGFKMRVPSLLHAIAMRLQTIKNEPDREMENLPDILTFLRINKGRWKEDELDAVCKRFGPRGIYIRIAQRLLT